MRRLSRKRVRAGLTAISISILSWAPLMAVCPSGDVPHRLTVDVKAFAALDRFVLWDLGPEMFMRIYVDDELTCLPERFDGWEIDGECVFDIPEPYDPVEIEIEVMDSDPPLDDYTVDIAAGPDRTLKFTYDPLCGTIAEVNLGDLPGCPAGNHLPECRGREIRSDGGEAIARIHVAPEAAVSLLDDSLSLDNMQVIQVTPHVDRLLTDRPTVVRLDVASSHHLDMTATITVTARDRAGRVFVDDQTVIVPECGVVPKVTFFGPGWDGPGSEAGFRPQDGPVNIFSVEAEIDPAADCEGAIPPCQPPFDCRIVDGQIRDVQTELVQPRVLRALYQPFWRRPSAPCSDDYEAALPPIADAAARPILEDLFPINAYDGDTTSIRMLWPLPTGAGLIDVVDLIDPRPGLIMLDLPAAIAGLDRWVIVLHDSNTGDDRGLQCHWISMDRSNAVGASAGGNSRVVLVEPEGASVPRGGRVAHEIAHTFGCSEAPCPLRGDPFGGMTCEDEYNFPAGYTVTGGGVSSEGVQVLRWTGGVVPDMDGSPCLLGFAGAGSWIDSFDYGKLLDELTQPLVPGPALHVRVRLTPGFGGSFLTEDIARITASPTQEFDWVTGRDPAAFATSIRVLRADGSSLGTISFNLENVDEDGDGISEGFAYTHGELESLPFFDTAVIFSVPPDAQRMELVRRSPGPGDTVIETVTDIYVLSSPPFFLEPLAPRSSFRARIGEEYELTWEALPSFESTASTVSTRSYVFLSDDEGQTWIPIAAYLPGNSFTWVADVEGRYQMRVFSTSGFESADVRGDPDVDQDGCGAQQDPQPQLPDPDGADDDGVAQICDVCPETYDPLQAESDGDGLGDACDNCPDVPNASQANQDGDPLGDICDCLPQDPGAWTVPGVVSGLQVLANGQGPDYSDLFWSSQSGESGPQTVHDVMSGDVETLRTSGAFVDGTCVAVDATQDMATVYRPAPEVGKAIWFLVRGGSPCGTGSYDSGATSQAGGRDDLLQQAQSCA